METNTCRDWFDTETQRETWECAGVKGRQRAPFTLTIAAQIKCQMCGAGSRG